MDSKLYTLGYEFEPTKYSPRLGYARLRTIISGRPTERFFDVKALHLPTFDGRFYHQTTITRHELLPEETFQVCMGEFTLETYRGESLRVFSFGGMLKAMLEKNDLACELTSSAPILKVKDEPGSVGDFIIDELMETIALKEATLSGHADELYSRLARIDPYRVFLACLITLQKRADLVPTSSRHDKYHKLVSELHKAINIIKEADGWDGRSPDLDELLSGGEHKP